MPGNHDGKVTISTALDNSDIEKDMQEISGEYGGLKKVLNDFSKSISGAMSKPVGESCAKIRKDIGAAQRQIDQYQKQIQKAESAKMPLVEQAAQLGTELDAAKAKLAELQSQQQVAAEVLNGTENPEAYIEAYAQKPQIDADVVQQQAKVDALQKKWDAVNNEVDGYNYKIDQANQEMAGQKVIVEELGVKLNSAEKETKKIRKNASGSKKEFGAMGKAVNSFTSRLKSIVLGALIFNGISAGLRELTSYMGKTLKTNKAFTAEMSRLQGALLTAFQPIYNAVAPAVTYLIRLLTNATWAVAKFFAKISGTTVEASAEAAKGMYEEAKALETVGKSAQKAGKSMAGFDELNVLQDKTDTSGSSGGSNEVMPNFNVGEEESTGQLSKIIDFAEGIGVVLALLGNLPAAGAVFAITGVLDIITGVQDIIDNGINWDNAEQVIGGIAKLGAAIGIAFGNMKLAGISLTVSGLTTIVTEIGKNWEAIKNGDWSGVDKVSLAVAAVQVLGGLLLAFDVFSKLKKKVKVEDAAEGVGEVSTEVSKFTGKLKNLVKNLGLGIAIIAEVAVAVGLVVAAIWGIGVLLEQVGEAWQPVIDNGETVAISMGIGILLLAGIGVATAALGTLGGAMCGQIAIGIAVLAELGVATGLFLAEIWAVGWGLNEIQKAWKPVLNNGEDIATAIGIGTGLLVGIGIVTAALGAATVASAGALPLAIGLGTALLVELALAFVLFCDSLIDVADKLVDLSEPMDELNEILPGLKTDMDDFTSFMDDFALAVVAFTGTSAIAGIAATIDKVISFFTTDPVQRMNDEVTDQTKEFNNLIPALEKINPLIKRATELVGEYKENMGSFETATGGSGGFLNAIVGGAKGAVNGLIGLFEGMANGVIKCVNAIIRGLNKISFDVPDWVPSIGGRTFGFNIRPISEISIPRLAQGAVIPPNKEFLAVLGDQKHGTNVETPLSVIQEAVAMVMENYVASNLAGQEAIVGILREILEAVLGIQIGDDVIGNAVARYSRKQAVIRGGAL